MAAAEICTHRLSIVTGHYGTGKTEFAVNLALSLAAGEAQVMLADLDIVNPYFRSRERRQLLEEAGIRLVSTSQACADADVPAIPAELLAILEDRAVLGVLDRPEVRTPETAVRYLRAIEETTGLACSALVNNTHLCGETTEAEILKGAALAGAVFRETGIPVLCHMAEERFLPGLKKLREPVFPITIRMKKPWE